MKATKPLSPEEKRVILDKGTEPPFTGKYCRHCEKGIYVCRQCGGPLFRADDKFESGCGWPAFDSEIPGMVKRTPDPDGRRTEITCASCGAHLGHVFNGEQLTPADTRHCVNSVSMEFAGLDSAGIGRAIFAGGCFWGVEYYFKQQPGVLAVTSGYCGGTVDYPTYEDVCTGRTGHAEAVEIIYDKTLTDFETLAKLFLEIHDPTQLDRQGPDTGTQYRSAIFYLDDEQKSIAGNLLQQLRRMGYDVVTAVEPAGRFWNAEVYHQDYYRRKGTLPYCHQRTKRFQDKGDSGINSSI